MKKTRVYTYTIVALSLVLSAAVAIIISSCGGSTTPTSATTGTVNVSMSDPVTCGANLPHIYLTITKVTANINANAGPSDSGWQTLVDLTGSPMQIDLPSLNPTITCVLKTLGSSGPLPPGKYQQIRLYLLANNATSGPSQNSCTDTTTTPPTTHGWNCVDTGSGLVELQLPSEVQTGLKIPSPNIASGGLTVMAGQSVDLDLDIQSCASIVRQGNGMYRLKPVLFASEVSKDMNSISGQVVVGDSNGQPLLTSGLPTPVSGATVLFEHATNGNETIMDSTSTDSSGKFFVCPVQGEAPFDIVVTAQVSGSSGTTTYNPTVAFNVPLGTDVGNIPLVPETPSATMPTFGAATLKGQVDTSSNPETVTLIPTMPINSTNVIIPVFTEGGSAVMGQSPSVMTTSSPGTPACTVSGADCYNFALTVPASNPNVGTYSSGPITFNTQSGPVTYDLTASSTSCTTKSTDTATSLTATPDGTAPLSSSLSLTGCQ